MIYFILSSKFLLLHLSARRKAYQPNATAPFTIWREYVGIEPTWEASNSSNRFWRPEGTPAPIYPHINFVFYMSAPPINISKDKYIVLLHYVIFFIGNFNEKYHYHKRLLSSAKNWLSAIMTKKHLSIKTIIEQTFIIGNTSIIIALLFHVSALESTKHNICSAIG